MNILYSFPLKVGRTGIGITAWYQVYSLSKAGASLTLICGGLEKAFPPELNIKVIETFKIGPKLRVPMRPFGTIGTSYIHDQLTKKYIKAHLSNIDFFHGWPLASLNSIKYLKKHNIPTSVERPNAHTGEAIKLVTEEYKKLGLQPENANTHRQNHKKINKEENEYQESDYIFCPSDFVKSTFLKHGYSETKCIRHRYGYDQTHIQFEKKSYGSPFIFVFMGRGEPRKGLHFLFQAWEKLLQEKNIQAELWIAGNFESDYKNYLIATYKTDHIKFLGFVNDIPDLLGKSHALVLPSIEEGSAIVTYESRGAGLPILVSDSTGAFGENEEGMLVHPTGDSTELYKHMKKLATEKSYYSRLCKKLENIVPHLNWLEAGKDFLKKIQNLLTRRENPQ